jgi:hypothetical protein
LSGPQHGSRFAGEAPVVGIDFSDHNNVAPGLLSLRVRHFVDFLVDELADSN